jgi:predicted AAA+ superfamily ATPase
MRAVRFGTLPSIYLSSEPDRDLAAHCGTYLQEEIRAEGLVRRIDNFSRFLQTAAIMNTELINFEAVARDAAVPARTIREYFGILENTLVGTILDPFHPPRTWEHERHEGEHTPRN